jgi:hypothetical protein
MFLHHHNSSDQILPYRLSRSSCIYTLYSVTIIGTMIVLSACKLFPNQATFVATPTWGPAPTVNPTHSFFAFNGSVALSSTDIWVVGKYGTIDNNYAMAEHWNGSQWSFVHVPTPNQWNSSLSRISALASNDIWAVGYYSLDELSSAHVPLIEHWDGSSWTVDTYFSSHYGYPSFLTDVVALASNNVWAIGNYGMPDYDRGEKPTSAIMHWDGTKWTIVQKVESVTLGNMVALAPDNIWSTSLNEKEGYYHWNGTQWSFIPGKIQATALSVLPSGDIWTLGTLTNQSIVEHWNGSTWALMPPIEIAQNSQWYDIAALAPDNIWIVGTSNKLTCIGHWDGTQWSLILSPSPGKFSNQLETIVSVTSQDIWAFGTSRNSNADAFDQPLFFHWNGIQWQM